MQPCSVRGVHAVQQRTWEPSPPPSHIVETEYKRRATRACWQACCCSGCAVMCVQCCSKTKKLLLHVQCHASRHESAMGKAWRKCHAKCHARKMEIPEKRTGRRSSEECIAEQARNARRRVSRAAFAVRRATPPRRDIV